MLSAVEVLEWFEENINSESFVKVFGCYCTIETILDKFTSQEIVDRIEKYEAEKKTEINRGLTEQKFNVGDWVCNKKTKNIAKVIGIDEKGYEIDNGHLIGYINPNEWKHAEPPKEEKQTRADKFKELIKGTEFEYAFMDRSFSADYPDTMKSWRDKDYWMEEIEKDICEEKQKIARIPFTEICHYDRILRGDGSINIICNKINELVDAVNELRGV